MTDLRDFIVIWFLSWIQTFISMFSIIIIQQLPSPFIHLFLKKINYTVHQNTHFHTNNGTQCAISHKPYQSSNSKSDNPKDLLHALQRKGVTISERLNTWTFYLWLIEYQQQVILLLVSKMINTCLYGKLSSLHNVYRVVFNPHVFIQYILYFDHTKRGFLLEQSS